MVVSAKHKDGRLGVFQTYNMDNLFPVGSVIADRHMTGNQTVARERLGKSRKPRSDGTLTHKKSGLSSIASKNHSSLIISRGDCTVVFLSNAKTVRFGMTTRVTFTYLAFAWTGPIHRSVMNRHHERQKMRRTVVEYSKRCNLSSPAASRNISNPQDGFTVLHRETYCLVLNLDIRLPKGTDVPFVNVILTFEVKYLPVLPI